MTDIQVRYWANKETGRHNLATESQAKNELAETNRHNIVTENVSKSTLAESKRHNVATEKQAKATLKETKRSNKANESIKRTGNAIQKQNANTNAYNAQTNRAKANAEIALTNAKQQAQQWINDWKTKNPTTAALKEAGITISNKSIQSALGAAGLASDLIFQSTSVKKATNSSVKKLSAAINNNKKMTAVGTYGNYTIYNVSTGSKVSDQKTVIYDRKSGKFVDKIK